jgi:hypothetical protein
MKLLQSFLRAVVLAGSISGFFGGWAFLAHANKPVATSSAPAMNVPTLPPLNFDSPSQLHPLEPLQTAPQFSGPTLRTRGS